MIKYSVEKMDESLVEELKPLLLAHWEEIALHKDKIDFNPDYEAYYAMESIGALSTVIVRKGENIIGYCISFIYSHPHYQDHKFAQNDVLFVHPDYRGGTVAYRLLKFTEEELKRIGCSVHNLHMKVDYPFENLCEAVDMNKIEYIYSKYIGD